MKKYLYIYLFCLVSFSVAKDEANYNEDFVPSTKSGEIQKIFPSIPDFFDTQSKEHKENPRLITQKELKEKFMQCEEKSNKSACFDAGMILYQGRSVFGQDLKNALYFLEHSCDANSGKGCYEAGIILVNQKNYPKAFYLLDLSCKSGDLRGCKSLGVLYYNGWGTPRNLYKATELFEQGCKKGDKFACQKLYLLVGNAYQQTGNLEGAKKNFQKACAIGEEQACQKIKQITQLIEKNYYQNAIKNNVLKTPLFSQ